MKKKFKVVKTYDVEIDVPEEFIEDGCIKKGSSPMIAALINCKIDDTLLGNYHMQYWEWGVFNEKWISLKKNWKLIGK